MLFCLFEVIYVCSTSILLGQHGTIYIFHSKIYQELAKLICSALYFDARPSTNHF